MFGVSSCFCFYKQTFFYLLLSLSLFHFILSSTHNSRKRKRKREYGMKRMYNTEISGFVIVVVIYCCCCYGLKVMTLIRTGSNITQIYLMIEWMHICCVFFSSPEIIFVVVSVAVDPTYYYYYYYVFLNAICYISLQFHFSSIRTHHTISSFFLFLFLSLPLLRIPLVHTL